MAALPVELEEAAIIDGCSIPEIFFKITLPLALPVFSTAGIITFLFSYNDLFLSLIYISDRTKQPICVILALVSSVFWNKLWSVNGSDYGYNYTSTSFIYSIPRICDKGPYLWSC